MSSVRLLSRFRRWQADPVSLLGSWKLSLVLMISLALWQGFLAIWAISSPPHVVRSIALLAPFWIGWIALLVNTVACLWRRIPLLTDRSEPERRGEVATLRRRATLGTFLFHGSFLLIAAGFALGMAVREVRLLRLAVGESYSAGADQVIRVESSRFVRSQPPPLAVTLEKISPSFWGDELLFTDLSADLVFADGKATTRINRPLWLSWDSFLRLSGFGYAPVYELTGPKGDFLEGGVVKMNVFPPGTRDSFFFAGFPHRVWLEVLPDLAGDEGDPSTRGLALGRPGFLVRVFRGHLEVASGLLRTNQELDVEGLRLRFPAVRYWGDFSLLRDPGIPLVFLGMLLGLGGLVQKLRIALASPPLAKESAR